MTETAFAKKIGSVSMSVSWNLWHGCHKISEGCRHCYVYRQDSRYDKDSSVVTRTAAFDLPLPRFRFGYAEPQPIFVPTKIAKGERRDKRKFYFRFGYTEPQPILVCTKIVQAEYKNKSIC